MKSRHYVLITLIFGTTIGCLVLSLSLGGLFPKEVIYTKFIWVIYYPMNLLRQSSSTLLFILLYLVIWLYVIIKSVYIQRDSFAKTLAETLICMIIVAVPFVPFGIQYFSLLRYSSAIPSVYLRLLPFFGLFVVLLCSNFFYFEQRFSSAMIWAINLTMATIFLITMADLLPLLSSQPFFSTLNYRLSIVNTIVTRYPLFGLFLFVVVGIICCSTIDAYFLARASRRSFFRRIIIPFSVTVMVILFLTILQIDYYRYRQFDYSAGINTIYLTTHREKQVLWFDAKKIKMVSGNFRTLYPFGDFSARDTIRAHAKQFSKMAIIEGLNYYKLTRILNVLAHGERDTVVYRALRSIVEGRKHRYPREYADLLRYIRERFSSDTAEINVTGTITVNGRPLPHVDYFVNRWIAATLEYSDRIWMDKTDAYGRFHFSCCRGDGQLVKYFHIYFMLPDTIIGDNIEYLKIAHLPNNLSTSGTYVLDTISVTVQQADSPQGVKLLALYPETPLDSFTLRLPQVTDTVALSLHGRVLPSGRYSLDDINVVTLSGMADDALAARARERARTWRFYSQTESMPLDIFINTDR